MADAERSSGEGPLRRDRTALPQLADALDLALQAKQAHWNVKGPNFIALHELFEDIVDGLDNAPAAFIGMLDGRNFGKLIIRVAT